MNEYTDYDALGLAALVRSKSVSPEELLDAAISRIEQYNPLVNAVHHRHELVLSNKLFVNRHLYLVNTTVKF